MKLTHVSLPKEYQSVFKVLKRYWANYGGCRAVLRSPYLHASLLFGVIFFPYQFVLGQAWWNISISILPSIIGFSLGGYAIFLAFGDEKFKKLIAWKKEDKIEDETMASPYLSFSVAFLHFIIVQIIALFLAIAAQNTDLSPAKFENFIWDSFCYVFGIFSFISFTYALFLALAATLAIYRLVWLYDKHLQNELNCDNDRN